MTWIREYKNEIWHVVSDATPFLTRCGIKTEGGLHVRAFLRDERRCLQCEALQKVEGLKA